MLAIQDPNGVWRGVVCWQQTCIPSHWLMLMRNPGAYHTLCGLMVLQAPKEWSEWPCWHLPLITEPEYEKVLGRGVCGWEGTRAGHHSCDKIWSFCSQLNKKQHVAEAAGGGVLSSSDTGCFFLLWKQLLCLAAAVTSNIRPTLQPTP